LLPNTGSVRQIVPGKNFPATFSIRRFGVLETSTMRLAHRNVIDIQGVIDGIPPYKAPLTGPTLGAPRGDGPGTVVPAPNVVRGVNLPEAWYPANDRNEAMGIVPSVFFAESMGPCMSMLVDPSMIIQTTTEGTLDMTIGGRTESLDLRGDHKLAAGAEILLFDSSKHHNGPGVKAQLARLALVGESPAAGGRVMLRVNFFKVSGGTLGEGDERSLSSVRFPSELHVDAQLEVATPHGVLYGTHSVHMFGLLKDLHPAGTVLTMVDGAETELVTAAGESRGRISGLRLRLGDALVGQEAYVSAVAVA
jgi:hypothetical protein